MSCEVSPIPSSRRSGDPEKPSNPAPFPDVYSILVLQENSASRHDWESAVRNRPLQSPLPAFASFGVHKRNLLETRVVVTTYNHHVRLLSPEQPLGWFGSHQSLSGHGSRHCYGIITLIDRVLSGTVGLASICARSPLNHTAKTQILSADTPVSRLRCLRPSRPLRGGRSIPSTARSRRSSFCKAGFLFVDSRLLTPQLSAHFY